MQPSSSSSLARPRGEAVVSQTDVKLVRKASEVLKTRITCSFSGYGRDEQRITTKVFCEKTRTVRGKPTEKKESGGQREERSSERKRGNP